MVDHTPTSFTIMIITKAGWLRRRWALRALGGDHTLTLLSYAPGIEVTVRDSRIIKLGSSGGM
jgi:hypothetical protein